MGEIDRALYAYALTREQNLELPELDPGDIHGLRMIGHRGLGLVVGDVALADFDIDTDDLGEDGEVASLVRRHDAVVRAVFERAPVLPLRFCTVLAGPDEAVRLLQAHHSVALRRLDELSSRREWGVQLMRTDEPPNTNAGEPEGAPSGTAYLRARREARDERLRRRTAERRFVTETDRVLAARSSESLQRKGSVTDARDLLSDTAYLVHTMVEDDFLAEVGTVREDAAANGIGVRLTGPWPPYTFARLDWEVNEHA